MSRTDAHTPYRLEAATLSPAVLDPHTTHRTFGGPPRPCQDPLCVRRVPNWASTQPWARGGSRFIERRAAVRDALHLAARQYRTTGTVTVDVMPDPDVLMFW